MISGDTETTGLDRHHGACPFFVTTYNGVDDPKYWEADVDPYTREPQWSMSDLDEIEWTFSEDNPDADELVFQNSKFDVPMLGRLRPAIQKNWRWKATKDTLLSGHLLASNQPHDLTTMVLVYCHVNIKPYEEAIKAATKEARRLVGTKDWIERHGEWAIAKEGRPDMPSAKEAVWGFDMWLPKAVAIAEGYPEDHPWWMVLAEYSCVDSRSTLPLHLEHVKLLNERGLWDIYLERLKVLPVASRMEELGLVVNKERLLELYDQYKDESNRAGRILVNIAKNYDYELELPKGASPNNSLRDFVFDVMKLPPAKKSKKTGNPSLDKNSKEHYLATLPERSQELTFIQTLAGKSSRDTALSYMESYQRYWLPLDVYNEAGERLWYCMYPSLNPTGTDTLRWSSQCPNEQNISKKPDFNLRYMFGPLPGEEWWSCDASNIELRIPAFEFHETEMIELFERPDDAPYFGSYHMLIFDTLHHDKFMKHGMACKKEYAGTWYQWTKNGNFAVQYGAQEQSGTADRAYHVKGAQAMIKSRFRNIAKGNDDMVAMATRLGYVETLPDRSIGATRGYPLLCTRTKWGSILPTVPLSYHVQSTAMWWMMKAMIRVQEFLDKLNNDPSERRQYLGKYSTRIRGLYRLILQIHDEMVFAFPKGIGVEPWRTNKPIIDEIRRIMTLGGDDIGIPTPVGCEYHPDNWSVGLSV